MRSLLLLWLLSCSLCAQGLNPFVSHPKIPQFKDGVAVGNFDSSANWQELSGITSPFLTANFNYLWIESDSPANMIAAVLASNASNQGVLTLTGATAMVDLEDITSARIDGVNYLYGMDFGNNGNGVNSRGTGIDMRVFRIVEPTITGSNISTTNFIEINCAFPAVNGPTLRDCEASFVDPVDGKLYVITKRDATQRVYSLAYAATYTGTQTLVYEGTMTSLPASRTIPLTTTPCYAVAACISRGGTEILVKNYNNVYHFSRRIGTDSVIQALQKSLNPISYVGGGTFPTTYLKSSHPSQEPQGEGICFDVNSQNYFTNSEYISTEGSTSTRYPMFRYDRVSATPTTVTFQDGVSPTAGYAGTVDTYIWDTNPATDNGTAVSMVVDTAIGVETDQRKGLLKFDLSSIPTTAKVISATLELYVNTEGQGWKLHKMLVTWNTSSTYNSLTGGVDNDGVEAAVAADCINGINLDTLVGTTRNNVSVATVQDWVTNPSTNYGWLIEQIDSSTGDGVQFDTEDGATASRHPKLTIKYN